jgi:hypothetical protein
MKNRKEADNLMTARIREELDAISNQNKEDRCILTGLTYTIPMPTEPEN